MKCICNDIVKTSNNNIFGRYKIEFNSKVKEFCLVKNIKFLTPPKKDSFEDDIALKCREDDVIFFLIPILESERDSFERAFILLNSIEKKCISLEFIVIVFMYQEDLASTSEFDSLYKEYCSNFCKLIETSVKIKKIFLDKYSGELDCHTRSS